jgi:hypothetical protein
VERCRVGKPINKSGEDDNGAVSMWTVVRVVGTPYIYASIKTIEGKENPNPLFLAASFSLRARCSFLFLKWLLLL